MFILNRNLEAMNSCSARDFGTLDSYSTRDSYSIVYLEETISYSAREFVTTD
jgi:hypothetical protein